MFEIHVGVRETISMTNLSLENIYCVFESFLQDGFFATWCTTFHLYLCFLDEHVHAETDTRADELSVFLPGTVGLLSSNVSVNFGSCMFFLFFL